jgi:hypothetical protein
VGEVVAGAGVAVGACAAALLSVFAGPVLAAVRIVVSVVALVAAVVIAVVAVVSAADAGVVVVGAWGS